MLRKMEKSHSGHIVNELLQRTPRQAQKFILLFAGLVLFLLFLPHDPLPQHSSVPEPVVTQFPRKIWQLWKVNPYALSVSEARRARSWPEKNLGHRYELLSDLNEEEYVATAYGRDGLNRPDLIDWYRSIKDKIVRSDVLRYLIMYAEGGVYADIDVEALQPITHWIPEQHNVSDVDMVIGIEVDQPAFASHSILGRKSMTFCQWTFMSKPRHPVMMKLVEHIKTWLADVAKERGSTISDVKLDFTDIISGTGPAAFAAAMLEHMSAQVGHKVTWDTFHNIVESKLVGGILVLPVEAFAAGQGHSDSGNHESRRAFVKHYYHASKWPKTHPMFEHPMYGTVENCNWKPSCVEKWDIDVAAFEKLSKDEQTAAIKAKEDKERQEKEAAEREKEEETRIVQEKMLKEEEKKKQAAAEKKAKEAQKRTVDAEKGDQGVKKKRGDGEREAQEARRKQNEAKIPKS